MRRALLLVAVVASACGHPTTPSSPLPLALAGQSGALLMRPYLAQAYPGAVVGFQQDGSQIRDWADGMPFWMALAPTLRQPLRAFVWWLGESDRDDPIAIPGAFSLFLARVRREANDPALLVVLCRAVDHPLFTGVRAAEEAYVRTDPRAVLVSSDGLALEGPDSAHLSGEGYRLMAQRVIAVLP